MAQGTTKGVPIDTDPLLAADSDLLVPSQKAVKSYAQPQLNGLGFVKASGTTISYDNSTYLTSAITSLNGLTASSQTFATPGNTGTSPNWSSVSPNHTLNIPLASTASVTAGLISKTDYDTFNGKATDSLVVHLAGTETITGSKAFTNNNTFAYNTPNSTVVAISSNKTQLANSSIDNVLSLSSTYNGSTFGGGTISPLNITNSNTFSAALANITYGIIIGGTTTTSVTNNTIGAFLYNPTINDNNTGNNTVHRGITLTPSTIIGTGASINTLTAFLYNGTFAGVSGNIDINGNAIISATPTFASTLRNVSGIAMYSATPIYNNTGNVGVGYYYNKSGTNSNTPTAFQNVNGNNFFNSTSGVTRVANSTIAWQGGTYTPTFAVLGSTSARSLIHASDNTAGTVGSIQGASIFSGTSGNFPNIYAATNSYTVNTGTNPTLTTGAGYSYFSQGNGGYYSSLSFTGTGTNSKTFNGLANYFYFQTSGGALSLTGSLYGIRSSAQFVDIASSGITVTEIDDIILESPIFQSGITTITTRVGLNIAFSTTNVTNAWGIYQSNANVKNYFNGSVGLGTTAINASAILDISSTTKGVLFPRMTNANRTGITGVVGLIVYQTDGTEGLYLYKSTGWVLLL
jgi:hypothetical protein